MTEVQRGLAGVVADTTAVSTIDEESGALLYRGYPVPDLAADRSFEEVAYLVLHGELPSRDQLASFEDAERSLRTLPSEVAGVVAGLPVSCHPMDVLRTAASYLGAQDKANGATPADAVLRRSMSLLAKFPTVVAADQRRRHGWAPIAPDPRLSFCENFFHMCFGVIPAPEVTRCFEISLILYAEHGFNASTFTARVITSTLSDPYSAVTGAIGALKGPLHGGANEAVMTMFAEIGSADRARPWLAAALQSRRLLMGFGHRVYKHGDSRVPTMRAALEVLAERTDEGRSLMALYEALATAVQDSKGLYPNLDYATGPAYHLMGFDTLTFTPIFVMSRATGWAAHIMEQLAHNSLIRPLSAYSGPARRAAPPRA
jgi:citrate synthase